MPYIKTRIANVISKQWCAASSDPWSATQVHTGNCLAEYNNPLKIILNGKISDKLQNEIQITGNLFIQEAVQILCLWEKAQSTLSNRVAQ